MNLKKLLISLCFFLLLYSCTNTQMSLTGENLQDQTLYEKAVRDAAVVDSSDLCDTLIAISQDTENLIWSDDSSMVLMVMWKSQQSYEQFYKNDSLTSPSEAYVTWVTTAPQVQTFGNAYVAQNPDADSLTIINRLKQYLGLMPEWNYDVFIELWVDPAELFRPCVDPEIDDSGCRISFGKNKPVVKNINDYEAFYKNLYFNDFRTAPGIPWTGLGYTYDWGNEKLPIGASEYIIIPGGKYKIKRVVPTLEYIKE